MRASPGSPSIHSSLNSVDLSLLHNIMGTSPVDQAVPLSEASSSAAPPQPLPVEEYPYGDTQEIGGDSVCAIQRRLLEKDPFPSAEIIELCRLEAQDLFEVKVKIIKRMAEWDPTGDWMGRGARALDNPRTASGEESLERLYYIWNIIKKNGPFSDEFLLLQKKVFLKK